MSTLYVQSPTLYLSGAGVIVGATSITLTSLTDIYGNVLTMANFGSLGFITLEPDTTNAEGATFTGVTANANGTYTLTGVKTVLAVFPYTQTSGLVRSHAGGTKVVVTDNVSFWNTFPNKANAETITGKYTFPGDNTNRPTNGTDVDTTTVTDLVTYGQLQRTSIAGATVSSTTVTGIIKVSVDPASPTSPIAVGDNDGRVPTQAENDALVGTSGTAVSSSNKLIDNADSSTTLDGTKVIRANSGVYPAGDGSAITKIQTLTRLAGYSPAADTVENTVFTTTITGGLLGTTGMIRFKTPYSFGVDNNGAATCTWTLRLKYGGSTLATTTVTTTKGAGTGGTGYLEGYIVNNAATNSQNVSLLSVLATAVSNVACTASTANAADTTSAIDTTANQTLAVTVQRSDANNGSAVFSQTIVETIYK